MERTDKRTRRGVWPAAAGLGASGVIASLVGLVLLALTISPLGDCDICSDAGTVGEFAAAVALLIAGGLGIAAAIVGVRYARTGQGAFGTISATAIGATVVAVILLATTAR
jgi:uncharacterized membrane protein